MSAQNGAPTGAHNGDRPALDAEEASRSCGVPREGLQGRAAGMAALAAEPPPADELLT